MARQSNSHSTTGRRASRPEPPALPRPGGKLGTMVDLLARKDGASADELMQQTRWQRHSVLGALSRLRSRGFSMKVLATGEGAIRAYQLSVRVARHDAR